MVLRGRYQETAPHPHPRHRRPNKVQVLRQWERAEQADILWKVNALLGKMEISSIWKLKK